MSYSLTVSRDHDGRRLDRTLRSLYPALPLSAIMRALRKGEVRLDAARAREGGIRVQAGQELHVPWGAPGEEPASYPSATSRRGSVPVLWRGEGVLIVNKPTGLLVQPDVKGGDSVITRVWGMEQRQETPSMTDGDPLSFHAAAVHRLDRNTTGVLAVALRGDALRGLERLFKERRVSKRYLAIVVGRAPEEVRIDAPLLKDAENNMVKVDNGGQRAVTLCRRLAWDAEARLSLVSAELLTGRTHQARVHLAHIGCPILGDRKYGNFEVNRRWEGKARRPLLHAFELGFPDDLEGALDELNGRAFRAPLPQDMRGFGVAQPLSQRLESGLEGEY